MSLSAPSVNAMDVEGSVLGLWQEFLAGYFDGGKHDVGGVKGVQFPKAALAFQEKRLPQPLSAGTVEGEPAPTVGISLVWVAPANVRLFWDRPTSVEQAAIVAAGGDDDPRPPAPDRQQRAEGRAAWMFLIRGTPGDDNAQKSVQSAAAKLFGLIQNSAATQVLAEKGIAHVRPSPPRLAYTGDNAAGADLGFKIRVMGCQGTVRYLVLMNEQSKI